MRYFVLSSPCSLCRESPKVIVGLLRTTSNKTVGEKKIPTLFLPPKIEIKRLHLKNIYYCLSLVQQDLVALTYRILANFFFKYLSTLSVTELCSQVTPPPWYCNKPHLELMQQKSFFRFNFYCWQDHQNFGIVSSERVCLWTGMTILLLEPCTLQ